MSQWTEHPNEHRTMMFGLSFYTSSARRSRATGRSPRVSEEAQGTALIYSAYTRCLKKLPLGHPLIHGDIFIIIFL